MAPINKSDRGLLGDDAVGAVPPASAGSERASASVGTLLRFGVAGVLSTMLYLVLVTVAVTALGFEPTIASIGSYVICIAFSYGMQSIYAFRVRDHSRAQVSRFVVTSLVGLGLSFGVMWITVHALHAPHLAGALAVSILIPLTNYLTLQHWVFAE